MHFLCVPARGPAMVFHGSLPGTYASQWKTPEGIEKHLSAQHTLKFLDHVKVMTADLLLN